MMKKILLFSLCMVFLLSCATSQERAKVSNSGIIGVAISKKAGAYVLDSSDFYLVDGIYNWYDLSGKNILVKGDLVVKCHRNKRVNNNLDSLAYPTMPASVTSLTKGRNCTKIIKNAEYELIE